MKDCPEAVRKTIEMLVSKAVERCHREKVTLEDFYRVMQDEQIRHPKITLTQLFERVFQRLQLGKN